jgi:hypothetical protein
MYWAVPHGGPLVPLAVTLVIEDPEAPSLSVLTHPTQLEDLMSRLYRRGYRWVQGWGVAHVSPVSDEGLLPVSLGLSLLQQKYP